MYNEIKANSKYNIGMKVPHFELFGHAIFHFTVVKTKKEFYLFFKEIRDKYLILSIEIIFISSAFCFPIFFFIFSVSLQDFLVFIFMEFLFILPLIRPFLLAHYQCIFMFIEAFVVT